jgi:stage III sporulation protein AG
MKIILQAIQKKQILGGGSRKITESNVKKEVIYQEINGEKVPVTQSIVKPTIEGAVITAKGAGNSDVKANIVQAVEAATGLATHKIQVFEMK